MPQLPGSFTAYPVSVVLDGTGYGMISFQAVGGNVRLTGRAVRATTTTNQAVASTYRSQIGPNYYVDGTNSGSTGDSLSAIIELIDGEILYVVWVGGDPGATATATFTGKLIPFDEIGAVEGGAGWSNPIAAGDGSLVYPALKSPNFVTGVSGWCIFRNGNVEFAAGTFRGSVVVGVTTIDAFGVHVVGPTNRFDVNITGGYTATNVPDSGAYTRVQTALTFVRPENPTPINGYAVTQGDYGARLAATSETPYLELRAPVITGLQQPVIQLFSQSGTSAVDDSRISILGRVENNNIVTNPSNIANAGPFGAETVFLTGASASYLANSVYKVTLMGRWQPTNTTTPRSVWRIRKTNAAGQTLIEYGRLTCISAEPYAVNLVGYFQVGATTLTGITIVGCLASGSGAGVNDVTALGAAGIPFMMKIEWESGNTIHYPNITTLV